MDTVSEVARDGNNLVVYVWNIDPKQDKIRLSGHEYLFNKELVARVSIQRKVAIALLQ